VLNQLLVQATTGADDGRELERLAPVYYLAKSRERGVTPAERLGRTGQRTRYLVAEGHIATIKSLIGKPRFSANWSEGS
jgi:hypothetical protein